MRRFFVVLVWMWAMGIAGVVCAQLPQARLSSVIPPGGKIGTDVEITASGADLDEASGLRFSHPGITAQLKLTLKAGQRVLIRCAAREIDSPLEPAMVLVDSAGKELEHARRTALIDFTAPSDGSYILKLHDAIYRGSSDYVYRLSIGAAPHIDFVMPPCGAP